MLFFAKGSCIKNYGAPRVLSSEHILLGSLSVFNEIVDPPSV